MLEHIFFTERNSYKIEPQVEGNFCHSLHRVEWVDAMRGIGISLVILFHVIVSLRDARLIPADGFAGYVIFTIFTFAMPVFMFLAGLFVQRRLQRGVIAFLRPIGTTIIWPYLLWGAFILIAEWLGRGVRNPVDTSAVDITLLWTPIAWLWFLWALAIYHLIAAAIGRFPFALIAAGVAALLGDSILTLPRFGHQLAHFLIFYAAAVAFGPTLIRHVLPPKVGIGAALLLLPLSWVAAVTEPDPWSLIATGAAIAGTVATVAAAQALGSNKVLIFLGRRSMPLYVSHIFFITATRIAIAKMLGVTEFIVLFPICLAAGFCGPIILLRAAERLHIVTLMGFGSPVLK